MVGTGGTGPAPVDLLCLLLLHLLGPGPDGALPARAHEVLLISVSLSILKASHDLVDVLLPFLNEAIPLATAKIIFWKFDKLNTLGHKGKEAWI